MVQKIAALGLAWLILLITVAGCSPARQEEAFTAMVLEVWEGALLVEPDEGQWARNSADRIVVPTQGALSGEMPQAGDKVTIRFDGMIMETYPARLGTVYAIIKE